MQDQLTTKQAAQYLGIKPNTLHQWRKRKNAPDIPYYVIGGKILYEKNDLDIFLKKARTTKHEKPK
jgi:excisionase family DNA binding protein